MIKFTVRTGLHKVARMLHKYAKAVNPESFVLFGIAGKYDQHAAELLTTFAERRLQRAHQRRV